MAIKASVLSGPTNLMAMFHPFAGPAGPYHKGQPLYGIPLMIDIRTNEVIYFDPWILKDAGIIHSAFGIILGPKGHGKSSLLKIALRRLCWLTAGDDMMRSFINDYKPEGSANEYLELSKHMFSTPFSISEMRVNPLEARLFRDKDGNIHVLGVLRMVELFIEFANNRQKLIGTAAESLRLCVAKMLQYRDELWSLPLLRDLLMEISNEDIDQYQAYLRSRLTKQMRTQADAIRNEEVRAIVHGQVNEIVSTQNFNTDYGSFKQAGMYVAALLGDILDSSMGSLFGTEHSLYDLMTQRATTLDWRGVTPDGEALMHSVLAVIKITAIESNRLDLLPHIEIDDEKHRGMDNPVFARTHSYLSEIGRATHICNLSATHRLASIRKGGVGSELHQLGDTIINNLGFQFIGKHENGGPALAELQERYSLSETDMRIIPSLPDYTFGVRLGDKQRIRYGRVFALEDEMHFLQTNSATDRMIDRPGITTFSPERLAAFAQKHGAVYLGQELVA